MYAYSFASIVLSINGVPIDNFAEGDDDVKVEPLADAATTKVGADGHMVASISANRGCTVTIKLQQTSPGNKVMQDFYNQQVVQGALLQPLSLSVKDSMKQDAVTATGGVITKQSVWQRGANANDCEWTLQFERHVVDIGVTAELASINPAAGFTAGFGAGFGF
jgi:Bacteriophage KPP10, Structural protein ORF10